MLLRTAMLKTKSFSRRKDESQGFSQQSPHLMLATTRRMIRIRMMRMMSMVRMVRMVSLVRICEFSEEDEDRTAIRTSF